MPHFGRILPESQERRAVELWNHLKAKELFCEIETMLKQRKECIEWRKNGFIWFRSTLSEKIPSDVVSACCAKLGILESAISDRGLAVYNPRGKQGSKETLSLALGPEKERTIGSAKLPETERTIGTAKQTRGKQVDIRPELISSHERLNPLRAMLHLAPLSSNLNKFGELCNALKDFNQTDKKDRIPCANLWKALGVLCPDVCEAHNISTFDVMQKLFPEQIRSLFELQFTIHRRCSSCKDVSHEKSVSINRFCIDVATMFSEREPEKHIQNYVRNMRDVCCFGCQHSVELQIAPPILAVYWTPAPGKSELIPPALHLSIKSVFDFGCRDDLDYTLMSFCSKSNASSSLWRAHCKSIHDEKWKTFKGSDHIKTWDWKTTCEMLNDKSHMQLFYVKTSAIPIVSGDCLDVGRWAFVVFKKGKGAHPAQIVEILKTQNSEKMFRISWDDGDDIETIKPARDIHPMLDVVGKSTTYRIGDAVLAKFGFEEFYSPACIERCFTNQYYLVAWDDGRTQYRVHARGKIRKHEADADSKRTSKGRNDEMVCDVETHTTNQSCPHQTEEGFRTSGTGATALSPDKLKHHEEKTTQIGEGSSKQVDIPSRCSHADASVLTSDKQEGEGSKDKAKHDQSNARRSSRRTSGHVDERASLQSATPNEGACACI
jgi:hypothetical protein